MGDQKQIEFKEVFFTAVTIPKLKEIEVGSKVFNDFKTTYTEAKQFMNDRQIVQAYHDHAGKSIAFGKIFQIAVGFVANNSIRVKVLTGEEKNIINEFHNTLKHDTFKNAKLYGYNNEFLYDMIKFRGRVHGIQEQFEAPQFRDIKNKPWSRKASVSLIEEVSSRNSGKISLINALNASERFDSSGILTVEDVNTYYRAGKINDINTSSAFYIKGLVDIKGFFASEEEVKSLSFDISVAGEVVKRDINVLEHILSSGHLDKNTIAAIVSYSEKEGLNKEDVLTLVKTALSKTKPNQKVDKEDYEPLKDALGLTIDYSMIQTVVDKGNLAKSQANDLIKQYKDTDNETKSNVIELTRKFLVENGKSEQVTAKKSLAFLEENL